eukprot:3334431-Lingulodinium_polyedra.AAC.1
MAWRSSRPSHHDAINAQTLYGHDWNASVCDVVYPQELEASGQAKEAGARAWQQGRATRRVGKVVEGASSKAAETPPKRL